MDTLVDEVKKQNIFVEFFTAWLYIFLYAFKGIKFIVWDMWVALVNGIINSFTKKAPSAQVNMSVSEDNGYDALYEKTKFQKKKNVKYHYSKSTMAKYEKLKAALTLDLQRSGATRSKVPNIYKVIIRDVKTGKISTDTMSGYSKLDINSFFVNEGYEVYDIKTSKSINFVYAESSLFGRKMSTKDLVFFLTQLSTYIKAGITLSQSVKILASQMSKNKGKQRIFQAISYELTLGSSFSDALAKQGDYFPAFLINMIRAAEATGTLQETLKEMADYYTEVNNTRKQMVSALTYPAFITVFAIVVLTFIIIYVVPQFTKLYTQSDIAVTGVTAFIIKLSNFLQENIITVVLVILGIMFAVYLAYKKIKLFRVTSQIALMKMPVVKNVVIYKEVSIFSKTFASLLRNNVFITESMDILSKITSNEIYKSIMDRTIKNIEKGDKISEAFADHWAVPDVAYYMIVTGESTGQLAEMMQKVSEYYQEMHRSVVNSLKSFIEPVMIISLALVVGVIIVSVIVPMFQLYNNIM